MSQGNHPSLTPFDKLAWSCSRCAPLALKLALLAGLATLALRGAAVRPDLASLLPLVALGFGALGLVAHAILALHVMTAGFLTRAERSALVRALHFGGGYERWRAMMRGDLRS